MIENSAVFLSGHRKFKNVNVEVTDDVVVVKNRVSGDEMSRYSVVEVAKADEAWDVTVGDDKRQRLVVQQGCGCSGMHPYTVDPEYSGALVLRTR